MQVCKLRKKEFVIQTLYNVQITLTYWLPRHLNQLLQNWHSPPPLRPKLLEAGTREYHAVRERATYQYQTSRQYS